MTAPLFFGVFPLGIAGGPDGIAAGPPDDFEAIGCAVRELQGEGRALLPRMYDRLRTELNVTHWQLFTLRDADSSEDDLFHQFGVLRSDYSPKPAFDTLRRLIAELG